MDKWDDWDNCWAAHKTCWQGCYTTYCGGGGIGCYSDPDWQNCVDGCYDNLESCLKSAGVGPWFGVFTPNPWAAQLFTPAQMAVGATVEICWVDSLGTSIFHPSTVDSVVFLATTQAYFDSVWTATGTFTAMDFTLLGVGVPDALPANAVPGQAAAACYGYTFTLPNIFATDTPYWLFAYIKDTDQMPDSVAIAAVPLLVSEPEAVPTLTEWGMIFVALLLVGAGAVFLGRRRRSRPAAF